MTFTPSDIQAKAIKAVAQWYRDPKAKQVFYLAGFAGTGKSTVYSTVLKELGIRDVVTCAYTGKAANVLRKKGTSDAMTIHGATYVAEEDENGDLAFSLDPYGAAATAKLIGIDECSMCPDDIANDLKSFGNKILVMGDPGQLPPIRGTGAFTKDEPDFFLHEIHRQAAESPIIRLATMARQGENIPIGDYGDGVRVILLDKETQHEVYKDGTQILCGIHKTRHLITKRFRARLGYDGWRPRAKERVICCRNDKTRGIFNGSLGLVNRSIPFGPDRLKMDFDMEDLRMPLAKVPVHSHMFRAHYEDVDKPAYERGIQEFDFAYALTVHKFQGSSAPHVTIVDDSASFREAKNLWAYTAITRAEDGMTLLKRAA